MQQIQTDGATKSARIKFHPNGTEYHFYSETNRLGGKTPRIRFVRIENGTEVEPPIYELKYGTHPFTSIHGDVSDFDFAPDGSATLILVFNVLDDDGREKAQRYRHRLPQAVPPYTPAASYTYVCSATDTVAREQAQGAFAAAGQAVNEVKLVRADMRKFDGELDGKAERAARRVGEEIKAWARTAIEGAVNAVLSRLYGRPGGQPAGVIMDRIWEDLKDPKAPLPNVIAQQVEAALKARGL